jgi:transposase
MQRRRFTREFKLEAVKLVTERGLAIAQAARDLDISGQVLRRWVKEIEADQQQAFPGHGQQKADQAEITRLRREVAKLKAERDILKKAATEAFCVCTGPKLVSEPSSQPPTSWCCDDRLNPPNTPAISSSG